MSKIKTAYRNRMMLLQFIFVMSTIASCSCGSSSRQHNLEPSEAIRTVAHPVPKDTLLMQRSRAVLKILKEEKYALLADYVSDGWGIRFSPYANVDSINDVHWSKSEFIQNIKGNEPIDWGSYDGSGEPILLPLKTYFKKFVYNSDFSNADSFSINRRIAKGNSVNNISEVYPRADFIEFHFKGADPQYGGIDWSSLILIFQEKHGIFYLIAFVHDQWTI